MLQRPSFTEAGDSSAQGRCSSAPVLLRPGDSSAKGRCSRAPLLLRPGDSRTQGRCSSAPLLLRPGDSSAQGRCFSAAFDHNRRCNCYERRSLLNAIRCYFYELSLASDWPVSCRTNLYILVSPTTGSRHLHRFKTAVCLEHSLRSDTCVARTNVTKKGRSVSYDHHCTVVFVTTDFPKRIF